MRIQTERLIITEFTLNMAEDVHRNSLDDDNRRFVPDEVFESVDDAKEVIDYLMSQYQGGEGPFVYPVLLKDETNIGYVQLVPIDDGWEIGYHIAKQYTGCGYASEAVMAFLPVIAKEKDVHDVFGICVAENVASIRVMEKCGFKMVYKGVGSYHGSNREIVKCVWSVS